MSGQLIKEVYVKGKPIPIPVPLKNVDEVLYWIESTLLKDGQVVTKVLLDDKDLLDGTMDLSKIDVHKLSRLEVAIENPKELAIHSLEGMIGFSKGMLQNIQEVAVNCWQMQKHDRYDHLDKLVNDLFLVKELSDHMIELVELNAADSAPVQALTRLIFRVTQDLKAARLNKDWKTCAHSLLNRLEYLLKGMANECENLQFVLMTNQRIKPKQYST